MRNIEKLSTTEKDLAIRKIIQQGVVTPWDRIRKIFNAKSVCSLRILFFGVGDCLFLSILIAACLWMFFIQLDSQIIVCMIFGISPFAYIALYALTSWKEHILYLYEMRMACKYTIKQITIVRMIYFSAINMILNVSILACFSPSFSAHIELWKVIGLSFTSVFLYGSIMLFVQLRKNTFWVSIVTPTFWIVFNAAIVLFYGARIEQILLNLTNSLVISFAIVSLVLYFFILFHYSLSKKDRGMEKCCQ